MSRVVKKPAFCICENKDADQLRGNREADQHLCFRYTAKSLNDTKNVNIRRTNNHILIHGLPKPEGR